MDRKSTKISDLIRQTAQAAVTPLNGVVLVPPQFSMEKAIASAQKRQ